MALLALAALAVTGTALSGSWLLVTLAAGLAVVLGAAATRITHSELAQSRRDAARDRAVQAQAYRDLTVLRTAEHAAYVATMVSRITVHEGAIAELQIALSAAQQRVAEATLKLNTEAHRAEAAELEGRTLAAGLEGAETRAAEAIVLVAELEQEIDVLRAELDVVTVAWHAAESNRRHA